MVKHAESHELHLRTAPTPVIFNVMLGPVRLALRLGRSRNVTAGAKPPRGDVLTRTMRRAGAAKSLAMTLCHVASIPARKCAIQGRVELVR